MTGGAGQNHEVPDEMGVFKPGGTRVEYHAGRVGNASCRQPDDALPGGLFNQRAEGDENQPAHEHIQTG